jgi:hypothetical protein
MSKLLSLAMKISADATGVRQSLTPVERALQQIDREAANVTAVFDKFATSSSKAAEIQRTFQTRLEALNAALKGGMDAQEYVKAFNQLGIEAKNAADSVTEAEKVIRQFRTEQQRQSEELAKYNQLSKEGLIDQETYNAAAIDALGINEQAADAARQRAEALAEAERAAAQSSSSSAASRERLAVQRRRLGASMDAFPLDPESQEAIELAAAVRRVDIWLAASA